MRRYLVRTMRHLGDLAIDVALLNAIARLDADSHIEVYASRPYHVLLTETPHIARVHERTFNNLRDALLKAKLVCQPWDVLLQTRGLGSSAMFYRLARASVKRCRTSQLKEYRNEAIARVELLDGLVDGWQDTIDPTIHFRQERTDEVFQRIKIDRKNKLLTVSPGSSQEYRIWNKEKFVGLINSIKDNFDSVLVIGSSDEKELCDYIAAKTSSISLAGLLELLDVCALLSQSDLHVGNDSGLIHVANGAGAKHCLSIGSKLHEGVAYTPWGQHMLTGDVSQISVEKVKAYLLSENLINSLNSRQ